MVERVDFYSEDEYEQAIALEEEWHKEEQAKRQYEEECAYQEYLQSNKTMKRYIDCELLEKSLAQKIIEVNQNTVTKHLEGGLIVTTEVIRKLPTADVQEVKHGKWIMGIDEADYEYGTCSVCGYIEWDTFGRGDYPFFCSNCGAKMDGGKNE